METRRADVQLLPVIKNEEKDCISRSIQEGQEQHLFKEGMEDIGKREEDDVTLFSFTHVQVKSEDIETMSNITPHIKTEAGGDTCGGAEAASDLDTPLLPDQQRSPCSDSDTDDSEDWRETSDTQSCLKVCVREKQDDVDHKSPVCPGCGRKCSSKAGLTRHMKCCSKEPLTCSVCGKCFERRQYLKIHMRGHMEETPFRCPQCGKFFTQREHLKVHMRIHTGEKPFCCSQCGKCFMRSEHLKGHMQVHTGEKPFNCSQCGKCFARKYQLKSHTTIHTGEKPFSCSQCGKSYTERGRLKEHVRIHTGVKPFVCSHCGDCFIGRRQLMCHMSIHTGEKPFNCSLCGNTFTRNYQLKIHMRLHTGEKPFSCSLCGESFTRNYQLNIHMRQHTGEKPFSCSLCRDSFAQRQQLKTHMKSHAVEKVVVGHVSLDLPPGRARLVEDLHPQHDDRQIQLSL
ncbi:gastrula zinc finger protein XlCGF28.1-like isoform X1 [Synchiropus splendidus]|uniref:gastrula zinc finger protein XlCGF28.1-like isoform X1 n=1 Tax=Synchiropus splendidus TaxID=270530 RepID=UPI00237E60E4|nr:gastrula zinc finger protein XlCGF28.1-like isoform X1 [Synchiropus splendidus]